MAESALGFDDINEDKHLAEEFLRNNEIKIAEQIAKDEFDSYPLPDDDIQFYKSAFKKLAQKIQEKAELFSQLEYLKRKIPKHELKQTDICLLVNNFLYWSSDARQNDIMWNLQNMRPFFVRIGNSSPLAILGLVAPLILNQSEVHVEGCKSTIAVCYLFHKLCSEVGLQFRLRLLEIEVDAPRLDNSGVGVITQSSDLDSAVDAFLTSTSRYPWKIRRLLVQESIYEKFKKVLTWKCNLRPSLVELEAKDKELCSDFFVYDEKAFLLDYVGNAAGNEEISGKSYYPIMVSAYRTTKELLSMLADDNSWSLSLWSSDISEANEIAFGVNTPMVWINDLNSFTGTKMTQSFYSNIKSYMPKGEISELLKLKNAWCKLSITERIDRIVDSLEKIKADCPDLNDFVDLEKVKQATANIQGSNNKFVEIERGRICVSIEEPSGLTYLASTRFDFINHIIVPVIQGNAIFYNDLRGSEDYRVTVLLQKYEELPIRGSTFCPTTGGPLTKHKPPNFGFDLVACYGYIHKTKVVSTSYGTIYAN